MIAWWNAMFASEYSSRCSAGVVVAELVEDAAQAGDVLVGRVQRRQARRHALERRPHLDHLDDLLLGLAHDEDAAPRLGAQEAFLLEQRDRLADRRARHAELLRQLLLVEADLVRGRVDVGFGDHLLQRRVRLVAQADGDVDRREGRQDRRGWVSMKRGCAAVRRGVRYRDDAC